MDWLGLIVNFCAIIFGLLLYILIANSKWGKKNEKYQFPIMLAVVVIACLAGWGAKMLVANFI